ncbi:MAG: T9SS type A sorting domain-containing protein [Bacteroidetes bacterium]|nr:T9SS type A sorting domain-containing protein [Bacteroidota bacterium]
MNKHGTRTILLLSILFSMTTAARPSYTGYSGASGSKGTCASSCHGSGTGTITVTGFPSVYEPGKSYTVSVLHTGGSTIANFNTSTRKGTTSTVAGSFAALSKTALYTVAEYENGIRASSNNISAATFAWTAPAAGTGTVSLYLSGSQGSKSGPNTKIVLSSTEQSASAVSEPNTAPARYGLEQNYPNPFNPSTEITYQLPASVRVRLTVHDVLGKEVASVVDGFEKAGTHTVRFDAASLAGGLYLYRLQTSSFTAIRKMLLVK